MNPKQFQNALRRLGWTQRRAAKELGDCAPSSIWRWSKGKEKVPKIVAVALKCHLEMERIARSLPLAVP